MKKLTSFLMSMLLVFCLVACSSSPADKDNSGTSPEYKTSDTTKTSDTASDNSESKPEDTSDPVAATGGKTLVVYYSATGSTERVAGYIASAVGGNTFRLVPKDEYSSADLKWTDRDSRVVKEHDDESLRNIELVQTVVDNWDEYDTIFIGYPIWWQIAAWPVDGFVKANDFSGKTVIPFCTSSSSGLGESGKLLEEMANGGNWLNGNRFPSGASEDMVTQWVESLNLND